MASDAAVPRSIPPAPAPAADAGTAPRNPWALAPALGVAASAVLLFGFRQTFGFAAIAGGGAVLAVSVAAALLVGRQLFQDLLLIAIGLAIVASISVEANLDYPNMALFGTVLTLSVLVPWLLERRVFHRRTIQFPIRQGHRWTTLEKVWLVAAVVLAWLILPNYFINSGAYRNWPSVEAPDEIARLFVGVNVVGIWDELFFICTVFTLLRRHLPDWHAIPVQAIIFVSFLWELGYREWGPLLTIPFAIVQAFLFTRTRSLPYVVSVHLLFDLFVFLVLVHAHNPDFLPIFLY
ncbi:CPBP family intramembrane glutamic endopeptidase [Naasia sp. SYSU D00057]|uniref:CPBP family intramembrane glutamic endopeptidase n=1 Tax=Naasia sp. SYSU D00057 TaxID=2817380 RepID=UPI001B3002CA|nr:CPBP family intramembrane glutamic endopeptidase [Naasia sp. SYSU D00057]